MIVTKGYGSSLIITQGYGGIPEARERPFYPLFIELKKETEYDIELDKQGGGNS